VKLKKLAHTVYRTQHHIVWVTRYKRKILVKGVRDYLNEDVAVAIIFQCGE